MKRTIALLLIVFIIIILGIITYESPNSKPDIIDVSELNNTITTDISIDENISEESPIEENLREYNLTIPEEYNSNPDEYINKYYTEGTIIGDTTKLYIQESNYSQFNTNKTSLEISPYTTPITIDVALLNSIYLSDENTTLKEHVTYQNSKLKEILKYYSDIKQTDITKQKTYYKITGMLIVTDTNIKPKQVKITINNSQSKTYTLNDTDKYQLIDLDYTQNNISKPVNIKIEVLSTYENSSDSTDTSLYIEDIKLGIDSNLPQCI